MVNRFNGCLSLTVFSITLGLAMSVSAESIIAATETSSASSNVTVIDGSTSAATTASADSAVNSADPKVAVDVKDLMAEDVQPRKIVPMMAFSQTSWQARGKSQVSSRGDFAISAGALYEIPTKRLNLRTGLLYMPTQGKLIGIDRQETILNITQIAIPIEAQYQILRSQVDGLFVKGTAIGAMRVSSKIEGSDSVINSDKSINGAGDLILGLGIVRTTPISKNMDVGIEGQVLKGQLGYRLDDTTIDQSAIQAIVTLNIRQ